MSSSFELIAKDINDISNLQKSERFDLGLGLPVFARGYLNCSGNEHKYNSGVYSEYNPYSDNEESNAIIFSPINGFTDRIKNIGLGISLKMIYRGNTVHVGRKKWNYGSYEVDTSNRVKGWGFDFGNSSKLYRCGLAVQTEEVGCYARLYFTGTGLTLYYTKGINNGKFEVYIDGELITTINSYNLITSYANTYTISDGYLSNEEHILEIVNTSDGSETLNNYNITIECVDIFPITGATYTNGSPIVTNIDTTNLCVGFNISSMVSGLGRKILSIDSENQITMDGNSVGSGNFETTITAPSDTNYDIFFNDYELKILEWQNSSAGESERKYKLYKRGGYLSRSLYPSWKYIGTIRTSGEGITCNTSSKSFIWNMYNQEKRILKFSENEDSWTYDVSAWRPLNNNTNNKFEFVIGFQKNYIKAKFDLFSKTSSTSFYTTIGFGLNKTNANDAVNNLWSNSTDYIVISTTYLGKSQEGYNCLYALEYVSGGTGYFLGSNGLSEVNSTVALCEIMC